MAMSALFQIASQALFCSFTKVEKKHFLASSNTLERSKAIFLCLRPYIASNFNKLKFFPPGNSY